MIANIALDDALILPHRANPGRIEFLGTTMGSNHSKSKKLMRCLTNARLRQTQLRASRSTVFHTVLPRIFWNARFVRLGLVDRTAVGGRIQGKK
jgi:hypothetical protein